MVQAYEGDGICAYFGVPMAHDDDPERAARTGLRILEVVTEYARDVEAAWGLTVFAVRVAINSGQAAVGWSARQRRAPSLSGMRPTSRRVSNPSPSPARSWSGKGRRAASSIASSSSLSATSR